MVNRGINMSELLKFNSSGQWELLQKNDEELNKGVPGGWAHSIVAPKEGEGRVIQFSHPNHEDPVTVMHDPESNEFQVRHYGTLANFSGKKGTFPTAMEALKHAHGYMNALNTGSVIPKIGIDPNSPAAKMLAETGPAPGTKFNMQSTVKPVADAAGKLAAMTAPKKL